jgi:hypothetical protein
MARFSGVLRGSEPSIQVRKAPQLPRALAKNVSPSRIMSKRIGLERIVFRFCGYPANWSLWSLARQFSKEMPQTGP